MNKGEERIEKGSRYQSSLVYITLVLMALVLIAAAVIARLCYLPYSKTLYIPGNMHRLVWSVMILPVSVAFLALWMSNILNKRLKRQTVLICFISTLFIALIPVFYGMEEYNKISYFTSSFTFFLVSGALSVILLDIRRPRVAKHKVLAVIPCVITILVDLLFIWLLYNFVVVSDFIPRLVISMICPVICLMLFVASAITAFSSAFSRWTLSLRFISAAYSCLCTAFEALNHRPIHLVLCVLAVLCVVVEIYDIVIFIRNKEKRNDS